MDYVVFILSLVVTGLLVGGLGRLALPGRDPMGLLATIAVGIAGSVFGGLVLALFVGPDAFPFSIPVAVLCATAIVYAVRRTRGGTFTHAAPTDRPRDRL